MATVLWVAAIVFMLARVGIRLMDHAAQTVIPDRVFEDIGVGIRLLATVVVATLGAFLVRRRPRNIVGWLFLVAGVGTAFVQFASSYVKFVIDGDGYLVVSGSRWQPPGATIVEWAAIVTQYIPYACTSVFALLVFPTGSLPSRRWRPVAILCVFVTATGLVQGAFAPWASDDRMNPFAIRSLWFLEANLSILGRQQRLVYIGLYLATVVGAIALIARYRRSIGDERHQIKWFAYGGTLVALMVMATVVVRYSGLEGQVVERAYLFVGPMLQVIPPAAAAVAVFKYRLYDIDFLIRRTIVFGMLVSFIVVVYVVVVVTIGSALGRRGPGVIPTVAAMGLVATGFQPVRVRTQRWANRVVFGDRAPPDEILRIVPQRLADAVPVDEVLPALAETVGRAIRAEAVRVTLSLAEGRGRSVVWPAEVDAGSSAILTTEIAHLGEAVGSFDVYKRPGDAITRTDERVLRALAAQAGAALGNVRLTDQLRERIDEQDAQTAELEASRVRLLAAQHRTRRRLENEIRERIEPQLDAVRAAVREAAPLASAARSDAIQHIDRASTFATSALDDLRDLARGLFPPLLVDKGVVTAVEAHARKAPLPVEVAADDDARRDRFDQAAESAVYYCCVEGLRSVEARAERAVVRLLTDGSDIRFTVTASGGEEGTIPADIRQDMADRVEALGGELRRAGGRVAVAGSVPRQPEAAAAHASASRSGVSVDLGR